MSSFLDKYFFSKFTVEAIPKYVYVISIFFFLGSIWYQWLFYKSFGINIFSYMSLSQSISNFVDKIPILSFISIISLAYPITLLSVFHVFFVKMYTTTKHNRHLRHSQFYRFAALMFFSVLLPMMCFTLFIPEVFPSFIKSEGYIWIRLLVVTFNLHLFIAIPMIYTKSKYTEGYEFKRPIIIMTIINFFVVIFYFNKLQVLEIVKPEKDILKSSWTLKLTNEESIQSSDTTYLLGKTDEYYFVLFPKLHGIQSKVRIVKIDDVKEVDIRKHIIWYSIFP